MKIIITCLIYAVSMQMCCGSAIPIWELLTRNEKMSYLYSTFAQLVSVHCKSTAETTAIPVNQCKRNLLNYGYERLQTFSNEQFDAFDPYQRGANELIWSSIMHDHPSSLHHTTRMPLPTPPASSLIILTHQKLPQEAVPPTAAAAASTSKIVFNQEYPKNTPKNPLFEIDAEHKHKYAMDMDAAYGYTPMSASFPHVPTGGPLVFRVRPDGTPVEEDQYKPLPHDDDLEVLQSIPITNSNGKHRKIATITALKQQRLASLTLQQQLQPPLEQPRLRRQFQTISHPVQPATSGYYYAKGA